MATLTLSQINLFSALAARSLFAALWEGLLLAALVALCIRLAPKMPAAVRFLLWAVTFLVLATIPLLHLMAQGVGDVAYSPLLRVGAGWSLALAVLWAAASVFRLFELIWQAFRMRNLWRQARPLDVGLGDGFLRTVKGRYVQLCSSADVDRPSVIGFFSPRILIPTWLLERVSRAELEQIVLHEMEHLRRGDDWINLLQKLALVAFPLNPILLWIEGRLCVEREIACDDGVLARTGAPAAYATCLTNLAEQSMYRRAFALSGRAISLSLGAMERRSELARRVYRILRREQQMRPWQQQAVVTAVIVGVLGGAAGLARCPDLVAFGGASPAVATYEPAVVSRSAPPTVTMVKAVVARRQDAIAPRGAPVRRAAATRAVSVRRQQRQQPAGEWLLVTSGSFPRSRVVLTVFREQVWSSSYAAVPTGAGWLFIQL